MKQNIFRKVSRFVPVLVATVALTGCDAHIDVPDTAVRPGHVLCEDGTALSYTEWTTHSVFMVVHQISVMSSQAA